MSVKAEKRLEDKQRRFCREYILDLNATQAAIRSGYSKKTARFQAARLLTKIMVQTEISKHIEEALDYAKLVLKKRLFDYWMRRAFYDITEIIGLDGNIKLTGEQLHEKGLDVCIDSVNKKVNSNGDTIVTYEFADKDKAADMLQRYIQMIREPPVELTGQLKIVCDSDDLKAL